ncbi:MAG: recombination protein O N-terminal domain-containing protein [Salibacteraceae bacterium]
MYRGSGLILRTIPYSDSAKILQCFTQNKGLISLFVRQASKKRMTGHLQSGSFIEFTAKQRSNTSILSMTDARWDPRVPTDALAGEQSALWFFTLELLQKSIKENLPIPRLFNRIRLYYAMLSQNDVQLIPLVPLLVISTELGLSDLKLIASMSGRDLVEILNRLGYDAEIGSDRQHQMTIEELFHLERDRFMDQFNIDALETLYLLE